MAKTTSPQPAEPAGRWLRLALGLSLALNLAVAGGVGGVMLKSRGSDHRAPMARDLGFGPFSAALTAQDRAALRAAYREHAPDYRATRRDMQKDFTDVLTALRAEPFDAAALGTALAHQQARASDRLALGQALISDHIANMTTADRRSFADRLETNLTRHKAPRP